MYRNLKFGIAQTATKEEIKKKKEKEKIKKFNSQKYQTEEEDSFEESLSRSSSFVSHHPLQRRINVRARNRPKSKFKKTNFDDLLKQISISEDNNTLHNSKQNELLKHIEEAIKNKKQEKKIRRESICGLEKLKTIRTQAIRRTTREKLGLNKAIIILPDEKLRHIWDSLVLILLAYTVFVTPFRISFIDEDTTPWIVLDYFVDGLFFWDLILNFFSAYYDNDDNLIISKSKIAINYLKGWFIIDLVSILPLSLLMQNSKDYMSLARLARLPRLYRLIKIAKLLRIVRMNNYFKTSQGMDRIFFLIFMFCIVCHITACFWYLLAKLEGLHNDTWVYRYNFENTNTFDLYIASLYWATISITVGFGDISTTGYEKIFQMIVTLIGITSVSFVIGSFTSVLYSIDSGQAQLKEKFGILEKIKHENEEVDDDLYMRIRKALKYEYSFKDDDKIEFLNQLPSKLKTDLAYIIHKNQVSKFPLFKDKPKHFVSYVSQLLRPMKILKGGYVYEEGDPSDSIYFLLEGTVAFTFKSEGHDVPFLIFDEGIMIVVLKAIGHTFGDLEIGCVDVKAGRSRRFTAKAMEDIEVLSLSLRDLIKFPEDYKIEMNILFSHSSKKMSKITELKQKSQGQLITRRGGIIIAKMDTNEFFGKIQSEIIDDPHVKIQTQLETMNSSVNSFLQSLQILDQLIHQLKETRKSNTISTISENELTQQPSKPNIDTTQQFTSLPSQQSILDKDNQKIDTSFLNSIFTEVIDNHEIMPNHSKGIKQVKTKHSFLKEEKDEINNNSDDNSRTIFPNYIDN